MSKILFWSGFGIAVRMWQLGIERRSIIRSAPWAYPIYAGIGGLFGYWVTGVSSSQQKYLTDRRDALLEKRRRVAEREEKAKDGAST